MRFTTRPFHVMTGLTLLAIASGLGTTTSAHAATEKGPVQQHCSGDNAGLRLPAGFCATVFADGLGHARHLVVADDGVVYVNTWSGVYYGNEPPHDGGFLVALKDTRGTGTADVIERFGETPQSGGTGGTGMGLYAGYLYAETNDRLVRYRRDPGVVVPMDAAETIVSGLPMTGDHPMHPFLIDTDGQMYVDVASATNSCQPANRMLESPGLNPCTELLTRGGVWRYDAKRLNQVFSPAERYATGIRNAEGFALDSKTHHIFVTQHGRDQLHSNWPSLYAMEQEATLPAEELLLLGADHDYGWPSCYYDPSRRSLILAPEYGGDAHRVGPCAQKTGPVAAFPAHWAPNGLAYYDRPQFPAAYRQGVFIAFHGSWNRAPYAQRGYNVVFQALHGDQAGRCEIFADGFAGPIAAPDKAAHRPSGLAVGPDGALYVSDDVSGRIYRIVYEGHASAAGHASSVVPCPRANVAAGPIVPAPVTSDSHAPLAQKADDPDSLPVPEGATREMLRLGAQIYIGQVGGAACTGCHGLHATGTPLGPNLSANRWLWSDGTPAGIAASIRVGVPHPKNYRAPMPAMGGARLSADQVSAVAVYVWALSQP